MQPDPRTDLDQVVADLRAQLNADEQAAREAQPGPWHIGDAVDPARVLRQVAAHREMLDDLLAMPHQSGRQWRMEYLCPMSMPAERWEAMVGDPWVCDCGRDAFVERMVRHLVSAYADRDDQVGIGGGDRGV